MRTTNGKGTSVKLSNSNHKTHESYLKSVRVCVFCRRSIGDGSMNWLIELPVRVTENEKGTASRDGLFSLLHADLG